MAHKGTTRAVAELRAQHFARMLTSGAKRSDCVRYASEKWGVTSRTCDNYLRKARDLIRSDWDDVQREQMIADILSQYSTLQMEARRQGQLSVALGCINSAAKLAQLIQ